MSDQQVSLALKAVDGITPALTNLSKALARVQADGDKMGKKLDKALADMDSGSRKASKSIGGLGSAVRVAGSAIAAIGIKDFTLGAIEAAGRWEKLSLAINTMEGSAARGAVVMDRLYEAAKRPGIGLEQIQTAYLKFKGLGYELEDSVGMFENLGNAIAATGGSAEDFDRVTKQLSQMVAKGRVLQEDVSVIAEAMPQIAPLMEKAFGTANVEKIREMGVGAREFVKAISDAAGTLPPAAESMSNSLDNLGTAWDRFKASFVNTAFVRETADFWTAELERITAAAQKGKGLFGTGLFAVDETRELAKLNDQLTESVQRRVAAVNSAKGARKGSLEEKSWLSRAEMARRDERTARDEIARLEGFPSHEAKLGAKAPDPLSKYAMEISKAGMPKGSTYLPWIKDKQQGRGGYKPAGEKRGKGEKREERSAEDPAVSAALDSIDAWGDRWEEQYSLVGQLQAKHAEESLALDKAMDDEARNLWNARQKERFELARETEERLLALEKEDYAVRASIMQSLGNAFSDSMVNAYWQAKQEGASFFESFTEGFRNMLEQMAVEMAAKAAVFSIFSAFGGGGLLGGLSSFVFGARAAGGAVAGGMPYTVGENRRETFVPDGPGRIAPTGGGAVTINVQAAPGMDTKALAREIVRAQEDAQRRRLRGALA